MHEWQQCESRAAALGGDVNGRLGPFAAAVMGNSDGGFVRVAAVDADRSERPLSAQIDQVSFRLLGSCSAIGPLRIVLLFF
jgi:hypothetical protein